ncbi:redoxin domain-containing protein [Phenylobacterium sp. J426]|uniref:redoxin domain-containing protein n=1 Tax=Phenylobacterium sp. J426 TaxID=2898439 RepID=UPI002150E7ED|nr:redoxin domain-containing protein [Phenylobacterium sp. J426]MCR5876209.1 redoxin domain-containing protein [Phenylobacterium sp. J426]
MKMMLAVLMAAAIVTPAAAAPAVGQPAPDFRLTDAAGKAVSLSDFRGRTVVLEWHNPGCPYVKKHYDSGNMQKTQATVARDGVAWLTINSGAPGKQGHMSGAEARAQVAQSGAQPAAYLLDPRGEAGRRYGAKTTPHMYVINKAGVLVYAGGIDDKPTANPADLVGARNHVLAALTELKAGKPVSVPTSRPYGCAVKYADS